MKNSCFKKELYKATINTRINILESDAMIKDFLKMKLPKIKYIYIQGQLGFFKK